ARRPRRPGHHGRPRHRYRPVPRLSPGTRGCRRRRPQLAVLRQPQARSGFYLSNRDGGVRGEARAQSHGPRVLARPDEQGVRAAQDARGRAGTLALARERRLSLRLRGRPTHGGRRGPRAAADRGHAGRDGRRSREAFPRGTGEGRPLPARRVLRAFAAGRWSGVRRSSRLCSAVSPARPIRSPMLDWHAMSNDILTAARLLAALLISVEAGPAHAQAPARAVDAAGSEREVVWYTAMNTPDAAPLRKRFLEKYPELNLTILRQPGEKIRTRILTEMRAGKFLWDVVSFNHLDMDALAQEGLLAAYASPETLSGFPGGAVDPKGRWAAIYVRQYVIGYNTGSVPRPEAPRSWEELLQPRWKEKFAMDESDVEWYAAMLDYLGREKGPAF